MSLEQIDRSIGGVVRFRTTVMQVLGGQWLRVHDVHASAGTVQKCKFESPDATHRVFTQPDGGKWTYQFRDDEPRAFHVTELERQLQASSFSSLRPGAATAYRA